MRYLRNATKICDNRKHKKIGLVPCIHLKQAVKWHIKHTSNYCYHAFRSKIYPKYLILPDEVFFVWNHEVWHKINYLLFRITKTVI